MEEKKKTSSKKQTTKKTKPIKKEEKIIEEPQVIEEQPIIETSIKKENNTRLIITVCMAITVLLGIYFAYNKILNPKSVFIKSINKGYEKFEEKLDKFAVNKKNDKTILVSTDLKFSMDADENIIDEQSKKTFEEFAKLKLSETIGIDPKNDELLMNFRYMYDTEDLFNIGAYVKNKKMYLELKNIFDKYIEMPMENNINVKNTNLNIDTEDLKYFLSKTKDSIINNMNARDFKQTVEKIKKDNKTIKVTKITYGLSQKSTTELTLKFLEDISKDSKYIKILSKLTEEKESEIKAGIKDSIKEIKAAIKEGNLDKDVKVKFGILAKGLTKKHVGYVIETVDKAKFIFYKNGDKVEVRLSKNDKDLLKASKENNKTVITMISENQELELTINKLVKGKKTIYNYNLGTAGAQMSGKVIIEKIKENKDGTGKSKITFELSMMGLITMKMEGNIEAKYVDKLDIPDLSNSIKAEDLSESDKERIMERLINNSAFKSLGNTFGSESSAVDIY